MDGGDTWHVASCPQVSQRMIINRVMMLRFRPIAPKPAAGGAFPGKISPGKQTVTAPLGRRVKRKYVRVRKDDNSPRRRINRSSDKNGKSSLDSTSTKPPTTLQLMPEKSDSYRSSGGGSWCVIDRTVSETSVLEGREPPARTNCSVVVGEGPDRAAEGPPPGLGKVFVESWVTVECVMDMCMDVRGLLGSTDVERIKNLERDTCPGFVSDGFLSRVQWVNDAYRRMVAAASHLEDGGTRWQSVAVWLFSKENNNNKLGCTDGAGFTCRVRVQYYKRNKMEKCWKIMPCDVWRLDCGGFAWRLDVNAALSLGL